MAVPMCPMAYAQLFPMSLVEVMVGKERKGTKKHASGNWRDCDCLVGRQSCIFNYYGDRSIRRTRVMTSNIGWLQAMLFAAPSPGLQ